MNKFIFSIFLFLFLMACDNNNLPGEQNNFTSSKSDIMVDASGEITNIEIFNQFLENVKAGKEDEIRIVSYTTEGDPILQDVEFDGQTIKAKTDTTRDEFGQGTIKTINCTSIETEEIDKRTFYTLANCEPPSNDTIWSHLLTIP